MPRAGGPPGRTVFATSTRFSADPEFEIFPFFAAARYHGGGAADAVVNRLAAEARAPGLAQLELFVGIGNHRAIAVHQRHGFEFIAAPPDSIRIDGQPRDDPFYRLQLPPLREAPVRQPATTLGNQVTISGKMNRIAMPMICRTTKGRTPR